MGSNFKRVIGAFFVGCCGFSVLTGEPKGALAQVTNPLGRTCTDLSAQNVSWPVGGEIPAGDVRWVRYRQFNALGRIEPGFELVVTGPSFCFILKGLFSQQIPSISDRCLRLAEGFVDDASFNGVAVPREQRWNKILLQVSKTAATAPFQVINSCSIQGKDSVNGMPSSFSVAPYATPKP
jgi:hypothetical protein